MLAVAATEHRMRAETFGFDGKVKLGLGHKHVAGESVVRARALPDTSAAVGVHRVLKHTAYRLSHVAIALMSSTVTDRPSS